MSSHAISQVPPSRPLPINAHRAWVRSSEIPRLHPYERAPFLSRLTGTLPLVLLLTQDHPFATGRHQKKKKKTIPHFTCSLFDSEMLAHAMGKGVDAAESVSRKTLFWFSPSPSPLHDSMLAQLPSVFRMTPPSVLIQHAPHHQIDSPLETRALPLLDSTSSPSTLYCAKS